jgi:ABC-type multidrug transport system permease subunit
MRNGRLSRGIKRLPCVSLLVDSEDKVLKIAVDHPFVEALALTAVDMPIAFITQVLFAVVLYFMTGASGYFP